jgi:hypothetical protein
MGKKGKESVTPVVSGYVAVVESDSEVISVTTTSGPEPGVDRSAVYVVAKGTTITSKRGTLKPGTVALPRYFGGGQKTFDVFVESKALVEKK